MTRLNERLARLEQAVSPAGTAIVEGVRMDVPHMIAFFRQRTIAENGRRRALGMEPLSWRDRPEMDESLKGERFDKIRAARERVARSSRTGP